MENIRRFALDVSWVLLGSITTMAIAFLLRLLLARWLGAADVGLYTMVVTIHGFATIAATLGIPTALTKYVAEYKDNSNTLTQITYAAFAGSIFFGLLVGVLMFSLSGILANVFDMPELTQLLKILAIVFPFTCMLRTLVGLANGLRRMRTHAYLLISQNILMISCTVTLVLLGFGVEGAVISIPISVIGACVFGLFLSRSYLHLNLQNFSQNVKKLMLFGTQVTGVNSLAMLFTQADIVLIGYFLADQDVGYYSVALTLSSLFVVIPHAIQTITYPTTSEYWSTKKFASLGIMIDKTMKYSACMMLPLGLGVGFFAEEVITTLFGQEFISAAIPFWVLLATRLIRGSTVIPIGSSMTGAGRPDINLRLDGISCVLNIILNILFIPLWGITGAAISTAISSLVHTALYMVLIPRILKVRIDIKWYIRAFGFILIAITVFYFGRMLINSYIIGGIILSGFIIIVYKVFLNRDDRVIVHSLFHPLLKQR